MDTWVLAGLGATGGSVRSLVEVYGQIMAWRAARLRFRAGAAERAAQPGREGDGSADGQRTGRPRAGEFFDPGPDAAAAFLHIVLGSVTAAVLGSSHQVSGAWGAFLVGVSAPTLLTQLGRLQSVQDLVAGAPPTPPGPPSTPNPGPASGVLRETQ